MLRRPAAGHPQAGKYNGLGGKLEPGESPEECLRREVREGGGGGGEGGGRGGWIGGGGVGAGEGVGDDDGVVAGVHVFGVSEVEL